LVARSSASDQKKAAACRGLVFFEDEASFWLDGTLHQTWAKIGSQPRVDTFGKRKTAHVFAAVCLQNAAFAYRFAPVFNGETFWHFLRQLVSRFGPRKIFLIIDNGPCHWLSEVGKKWLRANRDKIELHRLPPYSPEFNPVEGIWKCTRRRATHNRFYATTDERDSALRKTFNTFQCRPAIIEPQIVRFR
jgi:transposase